MKVYFLALLVVALVLGAWGEIDRVIARNSLSQETATIATRRSLPSSQIAPIRARN